jgi:hypothetical protein
MEEETTMDRKLVDVGHRVEAQEDGGLVSDVTHSTSGSRWNEGSARAAAAGGGDALQALKKAAAAVGTGVQDRTDEVVAYARREPVAALMAAAGLGFLAGVALAIAARGGDDERSWLPQLNARRTFLARRTGSGWRGVLGLK